jgi:hypothetical protein
MFKLRGSRDALAELAAAINQALEDAGESRGRRAGVRKSTAPLPLEIELADEAVGLEYQLSSIDDAVRLTNGWAEDKRCCKCSKTVALLFEESYLETPDTQAICCRCWEKNSESI